MKIYALRHWKNVCLLKFFDFKEKRPKHMKLTKNNNSSVLEHTSFFSLVKGKIFLHVFSSANFRSTNQKIHTINWNYYCEVE